MPIKIGGKYISGPNVETIVFPRGNGETIALKLGSIMDYKHFEEHVKEPEAPSITHVNGTIERDTNDEDYKKHVAEVAELRMAWMVITSLQATEGFEWEAVDYEVPSTWPKFKDELRESGFNDIEVGKIIIGMMKANSLHEEYLEEARKRFTLSQATL